MSCFLVPFSTDEELMLDIKFFNGMSNFVSGTFGSVIRIL